MKIRIWILICFLVLAESVAVTAANASVSGAVDTSSDSSEEELDEDSDDEDSEETRVSSFEGGTLTVKKNFNLNKKDSSLTHASRAYLMHTEETDEQCNEAKQEVFQAHFNAPYSNQMLHSFGRMMNNCVNVPQCKLAVETSTSYVTFTQSREYNITPSGDGDNEFDIEVTFADGGVRDAYFRCSPEMTGEDVIAALEKFGFEVNPGASVETAGKMTESEDTASDPDEIDTETEDRWSKESLIDESSSLYIQTSGKKSGGAPRRNRSAQ